MHCRKSDRWNDRDPAALLLASAWRLERLALAENTPPALKRAIGRHLELAGQAIAAIVGPYYYAEEITPLVQSLLEKETNIEP